MKKILLALICIMSINMANAQIVNIPDAIFKSRLVNNPTINTNGDAEIQVTEAAAFTGTMNVSTTWPGPYIIDLTGIEAFTALTGLDCSGNALTSLDVSANSALTSLNCRMNQLTSLDVSTNTSLTNLVCQYNSLTSLDVSANTALTTLFCPSNQLTSLNVSTNTALTVLVCSHNQLTSLDVSTNTALTTFGCSYNSITSLNVSANTALTSLGCGNNSITSLDVSANTALTSLDCRYSSITSLDVSANAALVVLYCLNNQLTSLNMQNGNNSNFTYFYATNNPNLTCIQVDNVAYSNANWSAAKDATASYSTNCVTSVHDIGNSATVQIAPNPATNHFTIALPNANEKVEVTIADISGKIIYKPSAFAAQKIEVNTNDFPAGVYAVQIKTADFIGTKKLVVEK